MNVDSIMVKDPSICTFTTSIDNIKKIMTENNRDEILIVDNLQEAHLMGKINSNTISRISTEKSVLPSQLNAEQCITPVEVVVGQNVSIEECYKIMEEKHISRVPVVDNEGHCRGIVIHGEEYAPR